MYIEEAQKADEEIKAQILEVGRRLYENNYVVTHDGNITAMASPGEVWVTPTGVSKGFMASDMLIKMDLDGNVLEGNYKPSSEVKMHLRVYRENPKARAVVHAHPVYATAFAIAGIPLEEPFLAEALLHLGSVPVVRYAKPGTYDMPDSIAPYCKDYNAVLLSNHGALGWGNSLTQAFNVMEVLENYAKTIFLVKALGGGRRFSQDQIEELRELRSRMGLEGGDLPKGASRPCNLEDVMPSGKRKIMEGGQA